jgi:hypothetical protein
LSAFGRSTGGGNERLYRDLTIAKHLPRNLLRANVTKEVCVKICILTLDKHSLVEAGLRIFYKTAQIMAAHGHDVTLVVEDTVDCGIPAVSDRITLKNTPSWLRRPFFRGGFSPGTVLHRVWLVLVNRYDVVYVNPGFRPAILLPVIFARLFTRTLIVEEVWEWFGPGGVGSSRTGFLSRLVGLYDMGAEWISKWFAHQLIVISTPLKERFSFFKNCVVLHGSVESDALMPMNINKARDILGMDRRLFIFGMCSLDAGDEEDNTPAFNALSEIFKTNPDARIFVTGAKDYIEKSIYKLIDPEKVIYPGWIPFDQYSTYLSACNVFVLPYPPTNRNLGRWPNKFGDYIVMRRPLITNPTADVGRLCAEYRVGCLCKNDTKTYVNSFIQAMNGLSVNAVFEHEQLLNKLKNFEQRAEFLLGIFNSLVEKRICKSVP